MAVNVVDLSLVKFKKLLTREFRISQFTSRAFIWGGSAGNYGQYLIDPTFELRYGFLIPSSPVEPETPILAILFVGHRNWGSQHRIIDEY